MGAGGWLITGTASARGGPRGTGLIGTGAWAEVTPLSSSRASPAHSNALGAEIQRPRAVVRRFLSNRDVMWMALLHRRRAHLDETRARAQFLNVARAAVAHARPQSADELIDERRQCALVRHSPLD